MVKTPQVFVRRWTKQRTKDVWKTYGKKSAVMRPSMSGETPPPGLRSTVNKTTYERRIFDVWRDVRRKLRREGESYAFFQLVKKCRTRRRRLFTMWTNKRRTDFRNCPFGVERMSYCKAIRANNRRTESVTSNAASNGRRTFSPGQWDSRPGRANWKCKPRPVVFAVVAYLLAVRDRSIMTSTWIR